MNPGTVAQSGRRDAVRPGGAGLRRIIHFVAKDTAPYKRIREVEFISQIPKSPAGKILRRELRAVQPAGPGVAGGDPGNAFWGAVI